MVAFSSPFPIASGLHDAGKLDGPQTRKKTVPSKRAQAQSRWLKSGARNYLSEAGRWEFRFKVTT
jgi:hypothetical protein